MRNVKVGTRLALGFGAVLAFMLVSVAVAFVGIREGTRHVEYLQHESLALLNAAAAMRTAQLREAVAIRDFVSLPDVAAQRASREALVASEKSYAQAAESLAKLGAAAEQGDVLRRLAEKLRSAQAQVAAKLREAVDLSDNAEFAQAQAVVYREARPLQASIAADLNELMALANARAQARAAEAGRAGARANMQLAVTVALALLAGVLATVLITRGIVGPLGAAVALAERVADGDLTGKVPRAGRDETGRVLTALSSMQSALGQLARSIALSASQLSGASQRLSTANMDLAARTEEQGSSLEETAASVEELTATVKQNSENAGKASALARDAARIAEEGGRSVTSLVETVDAIRASSRKVAEIVALIDGIAFQTNLLALNAAVEAARAGEHGRGFAVVAAEVRNLATRSAGASKEIRSLVAEAVEQADGGARIGVRSGESMTKVVAVAKEVAGVIADIAHACEEQRSGIEQVNASISQMEAVTPVSYTHLTLPTKRIV